MASFLQLIDNRREAILLGEIGTLLHMFGKCSSEFLQANSVEAGGVHDSHDNLKHFPQLKSPLEDPLLRKRFKLPASGQQEELAGNFSDFITKYKGEKPDCSLLKLFNTCHRMTSADEKGVVRRKQSIQDMWIATPFGYRAQMVEPRLLDEERERMDKELAEAFDAYLAETISIESLRASAIGTLKPGLSQALGETRQPANDVTLWAQSHGVASLYKPILAALALNREPCPRKADGSPDYDDLRWRLLGIGWSGLSFLERGRKPSDIVQRQELLGDIARELQDVLEVKHPVGSGFYADINGAFFTFPGLEDADAAELVKELAPELAEVIRRHSDHELWPFFTLSRPSRTLTVITGEIESRDRIAACPRVAALLSIAQGKGRRQEQLVLNGPALAPPLAGQDVCPLCQSRAKSLDEETCPVCQDRRAGGQLKWQKNRKGRTIWIDEVADQRGRVALLTLRFDLSRWLSGEWFTTLWSQTLDDWWSSERMSKVRDNQQQSKKLGKLVPSLQPTVQVATQILSSVGIGNVVQDVGFRAAILESFFEEGVTVEQVESHRYYIGRVLENLRRRINDDPNYQMQAEDLATALFTQNPSPARLARIWEETEAFLEQWINRMEKITFADRPRRLAFSTVLPVAGVQQGQTYQISLRQLAPGPLAVLCMDEDRSHFLTIDALDRFQYRQRDRRLRGLGAVRAALEDAGIESWVDDSTDEQLSIEAPVALAAGSFQTEPYLPLILLARSPVFCQLLVPAERVPEAICELLTVAGQRFSRVGGKLPIRLSVLVARRKFPLYALVEAGQQALDHPSFSSGALEPPWWDTETGTPDEFYSYYPRATPAGGVDRLAGLVRPQPDQAVWLTPGWFDFDFLGSTADRRRLTYVEDESRPVRPAIAYGQLHPRPIRLHKLREMVYLWKLLKSLLGPTQLHGIEEALTTKLDEWKTVGSAAMPVFNKFATATLCDALGDRWKTLDERQAKLLDSSMTSGLFLETLELFGHLLREGSDYE